MYSVAISDSIRRSLRKLPKSLQERLLRGAYKLEQDPRPPGSTKLTGKPDRYRIRVGDYRIVYQIDDTRRVIEVAIIAHRREVYRDL